MLAIVSTRASTSGPVHAAPPPPPPPRRSSRPGGGEQQQKEPEFGGAIHLLRARVMRGSYSAMCRAWSVPLSGASLLARHRLPECRKLAVFVVVVIVPVLHVL